MRKNGAIACLLLLAMGWISGCSMTVREETTQKALLVGFAQLGSESAWRIGNTASIQEAAKKRNISLMVENARQKQENQIDAIRSFIAYQVDVIVFSPIVEDGWDNVLAEAQNAGIPVILMDRLIKPSDEGLYAAYVGANFYQEGANAGAFLRRKAADMGQEQLSIVEISGTIDATPSLQRYQGFHDAVDRDARLVTLETVSGDFLRSKGEECMDYLLDKYGDSIDVLYSHNDGMTLGAIDAIERSGRRPGRDIIIISVDGEQAAMDLLKEGKINCVVECTPLLGELVMELAEDLDAGKSVARITHPEERVFTEYDDLSALEPRGY